MFGPERSREKALISLNPSPNEKILPKKEAPPVFPWYSAL
jgi:hypothetical protein